MMKYSLMSTLANKDIYEYALKNRSTQYTYQKAKIL